MFKQKDVISSNLMEYMQTLKHLIPTRNELATSSGEITTYNLMVILISITVSNLQIKMEKMIKT